MGCMGTDVATLVITVDGQIEAHQLNEVSVVAESQLVCQIPSVILIFLNGSNLAIFVDVTIDLGRNGGELGNQILSILECVLPVFLLVDTLGICFGKFGGLFEGNDRNGKLGHRMQI